MFSLRSSLGAVARKGLFAKQIISHNRGFGTTLAARVNSLHSLSEDEQMMKDMVARFARETVQPLVSKMDEEEQMDPSIIKGLFEAGLMGVETPVDMGGAEASFTSAIVVIEELAKIDPSVSVLCDVHNTLVNTVFRTYGNKEIQEKYLPQLAADKLGCF
ncbi:hypothetical protein FB639_004987, partial [Coemansia asiatica]